MKKSLATVSLALLVLTGCAANNTASNESTTASPSATTASTTPTPTVEPTTEPATESALTADPLPGNTNGEYPDSQVVAAQQYTAHVADNGDITWTDKDGNPVPTVSWETVMSYPFTQEELVKIQGGLEGIEPEYPEGVTPPAEENPDDFCATLDPDTASSGEIQYCNVEVGTPVTGNGS